MKLANRHVANKKRENIYGSNREKSQGCYKASRYLFNVQKKFKYRFMCVYTVRVSAERLQTKIFLWINNTTKDYNSNV